MLENLVTWVLNAYVGDYFENLNTHQLSVALLHGQVELENVPLKKSALRKFDIPLQVKAGVVGRLTLSIPITRMRSEPWVVKMQDLLILLEPPSQDRRDIETIEMFEQSKREQLLHELEKHHKEQLLSNAGFDISNNVENSWWGASLVSTIINNVQLIITNVHIRYEDHLTIGDGHVFCCGVRIRVISVHTTDPHGRIGYVQQNGCSSTFKILKLEEFGIYWNSDIKNIFDAENITDFQKYMSSEMQRENFILFPFNAELSMEKNGSKFPLSKYPFVPRFKLNLEPEKVNIELNRYQITQMKILAEEWSRFDRAREFRKWRPSVRVLGNAKLWWNFACDRIRDEVHQKNIRWTMNFLFTRAKHINSYCRAYRERLLSFLDIVSTKKDGSVENDVIEDTLSTNNEFFVDRIDGKKSATKENDILMKQIERDTCYTYNDLELLREAVYCQLSLRHGKDSSVVEACASDDYDSTDSVEKNSPNTSHSNSFKPDSEEQYTSSKQVSNNLYGWFTSWFYPFETNEMNNGAISGLSVVKEESKDGNNVPMKHNDHRKQLESGILDVFNESRGDSTVLRQDVLLGELSMNLKLLNLRFTEEHEVKRNCKSRLIALEMREVSSCIHLSPRRHTTAVWFSVGDMNVQRLCTSIHTSTLEKVGYEDDISMFGFGCDEINESTRVLFAMGKGKADACSHSCSHSLDSSVEGSAISLCPIFEMIYRRRAPKRIITHEIEVKFNHLAVMYDEDALEDFKEMLGVGIKKDGDGVYSQESAESNERIFVKIEIPDMQVELCRNRSSSQSQFGNVTHVSAPFALIKIRDMKAIIESIEYHAWKLKLGFLEIDVNDLFESSADSVFLSYRSKSPLTSLKLISSSCPNFPPSSTAYKMDLLRFASSSTLFSSKSFETKQRFYVYKNDGMSSSKHKTTNFTMSEDEFIAQNQLSIIATLVDSKHPSFHSMYSGINCLFEMYGSCLEIGMNRRTWALLLDFFGFGRKSACSNLMKESFCDDGSRLADSNQCDSARNDYHIRLQLRTSSFRVSMNYPKNKTQLGMIAMNDVSLSIATNLCDRHLIIKILTSSLSLFDFTRLFSMVYRERLVIRANRENERRNCTDRAHLPQNIEILIQKVWCDKDLQGNWDSKILLKVTDQMNFAYVHTHRYLHALFDFWNQFFELLDHVTPGSGLKESGCHRQRTIFEIDIGCESTVILPSNHLSHKCMIGETSRIYISNQLKYMSSIPQFEKYKLENENLNGDRFNCLIDMITLNFFDLALYEGTRLRSNTEHPFAEGSRFICQHLFDTYFFIRCEANVLSRCTDLSFNFFRNLDAAISLNVPDVALVGELSDIDISFTLDFYRLFRVFLTDNLGESLVTDPETVPIEVLLKPVEICEVNATENHITFAFRLCLQNVVINFSVPCTKSSGLPEPFGSIKFNQARFSLDSGVDRQTEMDLVCESFELMDDRREYSENGSPTNLYRNVFHPKNICNSDSELMFEANLMRSGNFAPILTIVMMNARVLLFLDWFTDAKNIFLMRFDADLAAEYIRKKQFIRSTNPGIVRRDRLVSNADDHFEEQELIIKVTIKECDLIMLDEPGSRDSLALVAHTTALLIMSNSRDLQSTSLDIQLLSIHYVAMKDHDILSQLTNNFSMAVSLIPDVNISQEKNQSNFLSDLSNLGAPKHRLIIEIYQLIIRASYRDIFAVYDILQSSFSRYLASKNTQKSLAPDVKGGNELHIASYCVKIDQFSFLILDDLQDTVRPLIQLIIKKMCVEYELKKLSASFILAADYFNQLVFGWEPLVEPWSVANLSVFFKENLFNVDFHAEEKNPLNINVTHVFLRHAVEWQARWASSKHLLIKECRNVSKRSQFDYSPYTLCNKTGCALKFTMTTEEFNSACFKFPLRSHVGVWHAVEPDETFAFEFPSKRLNAIESVQNADASESRLIIVRVDGWDDIYSVDVSSVGTFFRLARCSAHRSPDMAVANTRVVIDVSMDKNGRKFVVIHSALCIINNLPNSVLLICGNCLMSFDRSVEASSFFVVAAHSTFYVPLKYANSRLCVKPNGFTSSKALKIDWLKVKNGGDTSNHLLSFTMPCHRNYYWMCASVRREQFPDYEHLSGHTINLWPPLTVSNLLPIDAEFVMHGVTYAVSAGNHLEITDVSAESGISFSLSADAFESVSMSWIERIYITELEQRQSASDIHRLRIPMLDVAGRRLYIYASVSARCAGAFQMSLWAPYWLVNKSGIPLIFKQYGCDIAAGQNNDHESAKYRHPLMFSFDDDNPKECIVRIGNKFVKADGYESIYSREFSLTSGVHALKLYMIHKTEPTVIHNIGVEVRQGTGRYKDTQVVLFTPRYILVNNTSYRLYLSHMDNIKHENQQVKLVQNCNLIWHESFEDDRMLCVRREDVKYCSCPFRIDKICSFHVTMRDAAENPRFLRAEIILNGSVFYTTFTDAKYFPPPIRIENLSNVPILYYQETEKSNRNHLRAVCKALSSVDYAWDDIYAPKLLILQVFENKSHSYDLQKLGLGPPLIYDNDYYVKLAFSFTRNNNKGFTDQQELVLEVLQKGKVTLNKLNLSDSGYSQLWRFADDGCVENIAQNHRAKNGERYVLDVLENNGNLLMLLKRNRSRDRFQKWLFTPDGRLRCKLDGLFVEARRTDVVLASPNKNSLPNKDGLPIQQVWELQSQRPGSGALSVECIHRGPTQVLKIMDRSKVSRISSGLHWLQTTLITEESTNDLPSPGATNSLNFDINIFIGGIGLSVVNSKREELIYVRFHQVLFNANCRDASYQISCNIGLIQGDNQLLACDHWQFIYCQTDCITANNITFDPYINRPAIKFEMNWTRKEHYDAFDCFRVRLCDMGIQLDELLLWKLVQFVQESEAADIVHPDRFLLPPNTELQKPNNVSAHRCYFGTLDLEVGTVALSVATMGKGCLTPDIRRLKHQFNLKLVSFENAMVALSPFRQFRYFETLPFLIETLSKFYLAQLKNQTFNIIVTMDAFGNPSGLASDLKESFEGLLFEGDFGGFVSGVGHGVTNTISKLASSAAHGLGSLTFDDQHELMRQRVLRLQHHAGSNSALAHFYSGVKGLGVGVFGGLTAIATTTYTGSRRQGLSGMLKGLTTGAVDTITKPVQGVFDLLEGTASALKVVVGGPTTRKSLFPENRVRLPRVCINLQGLLPCYCARMATAQIELLRINGFSTSECLLDMEVFLEQQINTDSIRQYALICSHTCYIIRQENEYHSNVINRIPYKFLKKVRAEVQQLNTSKASVVNNIATIELISESSTEKRPIRSHLYCDGADIAMRLSEKILRAKQMYEHSKRTLVFVDYDV